MALEKKTIDPEAAVDARIAAAIQARLVEGRLACAAGLEAAKALGVAPIEIGRTADQLRIHLTRCELGLFGHPGGVKGWEAEGIAKLPVPEGLEAALLAARDERGEIGCERLLREAESFSVQRLQVARVADRLGIRIRDCRLGAC